MAIPANCQLLHANLISRLEFMDMGSDNLYLSLMSDRFHSAFISYKHDDVSAIGQEWAEWVGQQLEGYLTPTEFVGSESIYKDAVPARLVSVFRDHHEIPGMGDLNELLHSALRRSRILVVLCSPRAAASKYVEDEVRFFKSLGRASQIVALILDGRPHSNIPGTECLPPSLAYELGADGTPDLNREACPVYIDLRSTGTGLCATSAEHYADMLREQQKFTSEYIQAETAAYAAHLAHCRISLISGVLGLPPARMTERERLAQIEAEEQRKKESALQLHAAKKRTRLALAASLLLAGFLVAAVFFAFKEQRTSAELVTSLGREERARKVAEEALRQLQSKTQEASNEKTKKEQALEKLEQKSHELQKAAAVARESTKVMVQHSGWGTTKTDEESRATLEMVAVLFDIFPPEDTDLEQQRTLAYSLTRLGDLLYGNNALKLSDLKDGLRESRIKAYGCYRRALEARQKVATAAPGEPESPAELATIYHRIGLALLDESSDVKGDAEIKKVEEARNHFEQADNNQRAAKDIGVKAAGGQPVSAWYDANWGIYQDAVGGALERLAVLHAESQIAKSMYRQSNVARANALDHLKSAIETATAGIGQLGTEQASTSNWQISVDLVKAAIKKNEEALAALEKA